MDNVNSCFVAYVFPFNSYSSVASMLSIKPVSGRLRLRKVVIVADESLPTLISLRLSAKPKDDQ